jgi:hypothetical protein
METLKLKAHVGEDGVLKLEVPTGQRNREVEVLVVMQPLNGEETDSLGWPVGFFDRTYGALADDPIERPEQLPLEDREDVE